MNPEILPRNEVPLTPKPWHRLAVKLHLEGWSNFQIAQELRQSSGDVSQLLTSQTVRKEIAAAIAADEQVVARILEAAGLDSIYRLINLRDNATSESVRYNAAKTLLEHGYGKAVLRTKNMDGNASSDDPAEEAARLKEELLTAQANA